MTRGRHRAPGHMDVQGRNVPGGAPVWALALIFAGSVLIGLGLVMADPGARMVWAWITG